MASFFLQHLQEKTFYCIFNGQYVKKFGLIDVRGQLCRESRKSGL